MSIFKSILAKIFPSSDEHPQPDRDRGSAATGGAGLGTGGGVSSGTQAATPGGYAPNDPITGENERPVGVRPPAPAATTPAGTQPVGADASGTPSAHPIPTGTPAAPANQTAAMSSSAVSNAGQTVDLDKVLGDMQAAQSQPLNWRTSIVDLLKLLGLDSSLEARKELARELNYTGSTEDSATMNMWLHKEVMRKLQENGGRLPPDLHN